MQRIIKHQLEADGSYTAVVNGLSLGRDEVELLNNGYDIAVDVRVYNPYQITPKQRRKIFALVNDIERHTGQPREYMRAMFIDYVGYIYDYPERISLSNCSKETASQIIKVILEWVFLHDIPLNYKTSDLLKEDQHFIYLSTIKRKCVICGKPHSDLAHRYAVGRGRNRNKINHFDNEVLALCREHHTEQHQIGIDAFNSKYHLINSWVKVDEKINIMLRGESNGDI